MLFGASIGENGAGERFIFDGTEVVDREEYFPVSSLELLGIDMNASSFELIKGGNTGLGMHITFTFTLSMPSLASNLNVAFS